jgi:hypothetical protein
VVESVEKALQELAKLGISGELAVEENADGFAGLFVGFLDWPRDVGAEPSSLWRRARPWEVRPGDALRQAVARPDALVVMVH